MRSAVTEKHSSIRFRRSREPVSPERLRGSGPRGRRTIRREGTHDHPSHAAQVGRGRRRRVSGLPLPAYAKTKALKIGYVSPQTGPLAGFAESDAYNIEKLPRRAEAGRELRGHRQGQPVQPEPRRRSGQGADRRRRDQPDARRLDARDHEPRRHHLRGRRDARHLDHGALAALVHRPAGQPRRSGSLEAVRLRLPLLLGAGGRHRRLH